MYLYLNFRCYVMMISVAVTHNQVRKKWWNKQYIHCPFTADEKRKPTLHGFHVQFDPVRQNVRTWVMPVIIYVMYQTWTN